MGQIFQFGPRRVVPEEIRDLAWHPLLLAHRRAMACRVVWGERFDSAAGRAWHEITHNFVHVADPPGFNKWLERKFRLVRQIGGPWVKKRAGDCDDKADVVWGILDAAGVPAGAVNLVVCRTPAGEDHMVVSVDLLHGVQSKTLILDALLTRPCYLHEPALDRYKWLWSSEPGQVAFREILK